MESQDFTAQFKLLRAEFPPNQINKLPKPTKAQTDEVKADFKKGERCGVCGQWHHPKVVHLDYVGHAALTDRFLDVDPAWFWEPLSLDGNGLPAIDKDGGLWIRLTICGVTRLGYGDAQGKTGGDAMKERIGDALRNAGMRFGAALDLWHKGVLHMETDDATEPPQTTRAPIDLTAYLAAMNAAKGTKALAEAAKAGWEATGDDRIVEHHQKLLAVRLPKPATSLGEQS